LPSKSSSNDWGNSTISLSGGGGIVAVRQTSLLTGHQVGFRYGEAILKYRSPQECDVHLIKKIDDARKIFLLSYTSPSPCPLPDSRRGILY
jgi:hypothetical protein